MLNNTNLFILSCEAMSNRKCCGAYGWSNKTPAPGAEDAEPVSLIPVGLPCLKRGRLNKKKYPREKLTQNLTSIFRQQSSSSTATVVK